MSWCSVPVLSQITFLRLTLRWRAPWIAFIGPPCVLRESRYAVRFCVFSPAVMRQTLACALRMYYTAIRRKSWQVRRERLCQVKNGRGEVCIKAAMSILSVFEHGDFASGSTTTNSLTSVEGTRGTVLGFALPIATIRSQLEATLYKNIC